jgi:hypothetical protein
LSSRHEPLLAAENIPVLSSERSELRGQLAARRQFAPAIHWRTRRFFLTLALRKCQQK